MAALRAAIDAAIGRRASLAMVVGEHEIVLQRNFSHPITYEIIGGKSDVP
jgi:hypothetical protein